MTKPFKIIVLIVLVILVGVLGFFFWQNRSKNTFQPSGLQQASDGNVQIQEREIDYSCNIDSDCEIKNVGNGCGYYPLCVNKNFEPHPPELKSVVCGFPSIDGCECVANKCKGTFSGNH